MHNESWMVKVSTIAFLILLTTYFGESKQFGTWCHNVDFIIAIFHLFYFNWIKCFSLSLLWFWSLICLHTFDNYFINTSVVK